MPRIVEFKRKSKIVGIARARQHISKPVILFDICTPKQVMFFKPMIQFLRSHGIEIRVTTREYNECNVMLDHEGIQATYLGKHGGASWYGKLRASAQRILELSDYLNTMRPKCVITLSNPEMCRAAYGMGVPIICFNDIPEADIVARLTIPLSTVVYVPWLVAKDLSHLWARRIRVYRTLDPVLWLRGYPLRDTSDFRIRNNFSDWRRLVVYRQTEVYSSYVHEDVVKIAVETLRQKFPGIDFLEIPRYTPHEWIDTVSLLAKADLFIGGGGTMNIEAAWFGTPVLDVRKFSTKISDWLDSEGLVKCVYDPEDIVSEASEILKSKEPRILPHQLREMTFPFEMLLSEVKSILQNS